MVYIQKFVQKKKEELHGLLVDYKEFHSILFQIGELNEKYRLDEEVIQQLYQVLYEKQGGNVTIEGIEALLLQCLLEQKQQMEFNQIQDDQVEELQIKSMNNFSIQEEEMQSTFQNLTLESVNSLLFVYKKALNASKLQNEEKCQLPVIVKQIDIECKKGACLLEKDKAVEIFTLISREIENDPIPYVFNEDLQSYISRFENYLLLNQYGHKNVVNNEQAYVFHESDEENEDTDCHSKQFDTLYSDYQKQKKQEGNNFQQNSQDNFKEKQISETSPKSQLMPNEEIQKYQYSSIVNIDEINQNSSAEKSQKDNKNCIIENSIVQSMRDLYPMFADIGLKDEQSQHQINQIEKYFQKLLEDDQKLLQQIDEKDLQIQQLKMQLQLNSQAISQYEKQQEDLINQNFASEQRSHKLQEQMDKLNTRITEYEKEELELFQLQKDINTKEKTIHSKDLLISELEKEIIQLKQIITENLKVIKALEKDIEKLNIKKQSEDQLQNEQENKSQKTSEKQNMDLSDEFVNYLESENSEIRQQNEQLKITQLTFIKIIEEKEESNDNLIKEIHILKKQIQTLSESSTLSSKQIGQSEQNLLNASLGQRKSLKQETEDFDFYLKNDELILQPRTSIEKDVRLYQEEDKLSDNSQVELQSENNQVQLQSEDNQVQLQSEDNQVQLQSENNSVQLQSEDNQVQLQQENIKTATHQSQSSLGELIKLNRIVKKDSIPKIISIQNVCEDLGELNNKREVFTNKISLKEILKEQNEIMNSKQTNYFNFAALEIIQTSKKIQLSNESSENNKSNQEIQSPQNYLQIPKNTQLKIQLRSLDDIQEQNDMEESVRPSACQQDRDLRLQVDIYKNTRVNENHISLQYQFESPTKTPSFQQVLKGDPKQFWDQLNKYTPNYNYFTCNNNLSQYSKSPYSPYLAQQNVNNIFVQAFPDLLEQTLKNSQSQQNYCSSQQLSLSQLSQSVPSTDYLNLKNDSRIIELRQKFENFVSSQMNFSKIIDTQTSFSLQASQYFYSDSIYRINANNQKERRIICLTAQFVYIINPNENFKLIRKFKVGLINRITFSNTNSNLCVIHVLNQAEYVIESCRRFDLNIYLSNLFRNHLKLPIYMVSFAENLNIRSKKREPQNGQSPVLQYQNVIQSQQRQTNKLPNNSSKKGSVEFQDQPLESNSNKTHQECNQVSNAGGKEIQKSVLNESLLLNILLKKPQNILKSLFITPWKPYYIRFFEDNKVIIYKGLSQSVKEIEFILQEMISTEIQLNSQLHTSASEGEKLEVNEIRLIDLNQNSYKIKTVNESDFELCLSYFKKTKNQINQ